MPNRCLYIATIKEFLEQERLAVLGALHNNYHGEALTTTDEAWMGEIDILQKVLIPWKEEDAQVIFEYEIPRMGKRIDVVLLLRGIIFCLEFKVGQKDALQADVEQVMDYALDLKEHMVEIEEMAKLGSGTSRQVTSFLLSRTACVAIALNADKKKPIVKVAQEYFTQKMDAKGLATSFEGNVLMYRTSTGKVNVSVLFNNDTIWLSQRRMSELFAVDVSTINYHLKQIDESGEVHLSDAIRKIPIMSDKWDEQGVLLYNLDAIIAVGYRVNSYEATQFRIWAREVLKEYIQKGFVLDYERLKGKNPFGADYFEDLLNRIREIRTSERRYYQKITDIYAECSSDYDPKSEVTKSFYKTVQNMMHYAVSHQTAAEIVYNRANAEKPHMGLTTWKNAPDGRVLLSDTKVAKNYLPEVEIRRLERAVSGYFDYIEDLIERENAFSMEQFAASVNEFLTFRRYALLPDKGRISREEADKKATEEYKLFNPTQRIDSDFDREVRGLLDGKE